MRAPLGQEILTELQTGGQHISTAKGKVEKHPLHRLGPSSKLTPQSYTLGHAVISVLRVKPPQVHQPRVLDSAAADGSPAHVPSAVGDQSGILKPKSSFIHSCTSGESVSGVSLPPQRGVVGKRERADGLLVSGTLSCTGQFAGLNTTRSKTGVSVKNREADTRDLHVVGNGGAPGIGGVAPGAYVDARGDEVPVYMPDEIRLSGGTPFWPVGTDVAEEGDEFVVVDDEDPLLPVDMEPGEWVVEEEAPLVPLAGGDEGVDGPERVLLGIPAESSTWRR